MAPRDDLQDFVMLHPPLLASLLGSFTLSAYAKEEPGDEWSVSAVDGYTAEAYQRKARALRWQH